MRYRTITAVATIVLSCAGTAEAGPFMAQKGPTLAPFAHVEFCLHSPDACAVKAGNPVIEMTPANASLMDEVNRTVNAEIAPQEEASQVDDWQISPPAGDCNDYAVTKQHELINSGLPTNAVRLAVAKIPDGEGHLVVVVKTSEGDQVLDNRSNDIVRWDQTDLSWLKVESSSDPRLWERL